MSAVVWRYDEHIQNYARCIEKQTKSLFLAQKRRNSVGTKTICGLNGYPIVIQTHPNIFQSNQVFDADFGASCFL
jgi:hypothetical protein